MELVGYDIKKNNETKKEIKTNAQQGLTKMGAEVLN